MAAAAPLLCASSGSGAGTAGLNRPADLEPGIAAIEQREQRRLRLRLDPDTNVYPAQLQGQTLVIRRLVRKVNLPQSWRSLAQYWQENGTAEALPTQATGGAPVAQLIWEDERHPVKPGDRVEMCRMPADAAKPSILSLRCVPPQRPADAEPVACAGEEVWLEAEVLCPSGAQPRLEWTTDAGEFVFAGGHSAGKTLQGHALVRWRAPVAPEQDGGPMDQATIRLKVPGRREAEAVERSLVVRVREPKDPYREVGAAATRVAGLGGSRLGPLFSDASLIAAGPLGSFYLLDTPDRRVLHGGQGSPRYLPLSSSRVAALGAFGGAAYFLQGSSLFACKPESTKPEKVADLPEIKRFVGLGFNACGDLYLLDSGGPPRLHVLERGDGRTWHEAPLEPGVDSPWLTRLCVDPPSNAVYIFDSRDKMVRQWEALAARSYRLLRVPMAMGKALEQVGPPVAMLPRMACDRGSDLPIQIVFQSGAVTEKWTREGKSQEWRPAIASADRQLSRIKFAVQRAVRLPDGDVLLGGQAEVDGETVPVLAQVSSEGGFRRRLPLPEILPRFVAVAPGGLRYVLCVRSGWRRGARRLILLGPDGWLVDDLGPLEGFDSIARLRPDRSSADYVLLVGEKRDRESVFRVNAADPKRSLELSYAGIPGGKIPKHRAVDVASSPEHLVVLDRDGQVLLFANERPVRYLGAFETDLRRPAAITVLSNVQRRADPTGPARSYVCVLPSGRRSTSIEVWEFRGESAGKPATTKIGTFPDPERFPPEVQLSSPVAMDTGFPDRPELLYVLDRGGAQVRVFDVAEIVAKITQRLVPEITATPLIGKLPFEGDELDMAIGPGQVVHIVDPKSEAIHTYARRP